MTPCPGCPFRTDCPDCAWAGGIDPQKGTKMTLFSQVRGYDGGQKRTPASASTLRGREPRESVGGFVTSDDGTRPPGQSRCV